MRELARPNLGSLYGEDGFTRYPPLDVSKLAHPSWFGGYRSPHEDLHQKQRCAPPHIRTHPIQEKPPLQLQDPIHRDDDTSGFVT